MGKPIFITSFKDLPVLMDAVLVARLIGCDEASIRRKANKGEIPSYRIGRFLRFKRDEILEYIEQNKLR